MFKRIAEMVVPGVVLFVLALAGCSDEASPTATPEPTVRAVASPTASSAAVPTATPSAAPSIAPTQESMATPTTEPTAAPPTAPSAAPTSAPTSEPAATPTAAPTATPATTPTEAPATETPDQASGGGVLGLDMDIETTWQQVFDTFTTREQNCIRDSIDSNTLDALLTDSFMEGASTALVEEQELQFFSCLNDETFGTLLIASLVAGGEAEGTKLGETAIACMQELLQGVNIVALFTAEDDSPEAEEFIVLFSGLFACAEDHSTPDVGGQLDTSTDDHGDNIDDATVAEVDVPTAGVIGGHVEHDRDLFRFTAVGGQFYRFDIELGTLTNVSLELLNSEGQSIASNTDNFWDLPPSHLIASTGSAGIYYVRVSGFHSGTRSSGLGSYILSISRHNVPDDHSDTPDGAIPIAVGVTTEGAIDVEGDVDYFRLTVEEREQYQIFASIGTLDVLWIKRKQSDTGLWTHSDIYAGWTDAGPDCGTAHTECIDLEPGDHYLLLGGYGGTGTYTLTVTVR